MKYRERYGTSKDTDICYSYINFITCFINSPFTWILNALPDLWLLLIIIIINPALFFFIQSMHLNVNSVLSAPSVITQGSTHETDSFNTMWFIFHLLKKEKEKLHVNNLRYEQLRSFIFLMLLPRRRGKLLLSTSIRKSCHSTDPPSLFLPIASWNVMNAKSMWVGQSLGHYRQHANQSADSALVIGFRSFSSVHRFFSCCK